MPNPRNIHGEYVFSVGSEIPAIYFFQPAHVRRHLDIIGDFLLATGTPKEYRNNLWQLQSWFLCKKLVSQSLPSLAGMLWTLNIRLLPYVFSSDFYFVDEVGIGSAINDQTIAMIHPTPVHPASRFKTNMAVVFRLFRK